MRVTPQKIHRLLVEHLVSLNDLSIPRARSIAHVLNQTRLRVHVLPPVLELEVATEPVHTLHLLDDTIVQPTETPVFLRDVEHQLAVLHGLPAELLAHSFRDPMPTLPHLIVDLGRTRFDRGTDPLIHREMVEHSPSGDFRHPPDGEERVDLPQLLTNVGVWPHYRPNPASGLGNFDAGYFVVPMPSRPVSSCGTYSIASGLQ